MNITIHVLDTQRVIEGDKIVHTVKNLGPDTRHLTLTPTLQRNRVPQIGSILDLRESEIDWNVPLKIIDIVEIIKDDSINIFTVVTDVNYFYSNPLMYSKLA